MNKRITITLRQKANELSTIKSPEMKGRITKVRLGKTGGDGKEAVEERISLSYAPGTTQQIFNKLKAWYKNLPGEKRSIETINNLKEMPC